ncbi:hypothetical protein [Bradyrhizobium sp.]|uniref:hypothetical protein n=1 Tax=Bradyrhizobium sp. TaxID=376 RepID=UPI001DD46561|nr:hypothetical protein [Bradyrhizobium sp.]MBI5318806.1 hypothetical protein [Bradyrhizobium sp.]
MIHKGIEFTVVAAEAPGIWRWQFTINGETRGGRTEARLELLAIRRVRLRIDRALKQARRHADDPAP